MSQLKSMQEDKLLTNVALGYFPKKFICESILPEVKSAQYTGSLGSYGTAHLRIVNSKIAGKGKYRQVDGFATSTQTYSIKGHGLSDIVTDEDYRNVLLPFKAESDKVMALQTMLYLEKEKALADVLGDTAELTQNVTLAGNDQFNDYLNSDPLDVGSDARAAIYAGCGEIPNTVIMSWLVWDKLRFHPAILNALGFKDNRPGGLQEAELASALGVQKVFIGSAMYESAQEGQTSSLASVWGKNLIFAVVPDSAQVGQVSLGYTMRLDGSSPRKVYKQSLFNPPNSTEVLVEDSYEQLIAQASAAYLVKNAIA